VVGRHGVDRPVQHPSGAKPLRSVLRWSLRECPVCAPTPAHRPREVDPSSIFTPVYFLLTFSGFLTYAATVLLAYFDSERLKRDGVVRPFHWAWSFLSGAVYVIGRSVIVAKVAPGRGLAPIWVLIGVLCLSFVVTTVKMSALMSSMIESIPM